MGIPMKHWSLRRGSKAPGTFFDSGINVSGRVSMVVASNVSHFEGITMAPSDLILGVSEAFKVDNHELKLSLGVEAYQTEDVHPYVLDVVKKVSVLFYSSW